MGVQAIVNSGRRLIATSLLDRARIQDRTMVRDSTGGQTEVWVERTRTIACRFVQVKDDDPVLNLDSVFGPTSMVLLMPIGTLFAEGDRVRNFLNERLYVITRDVSMPSETAVIAKAGIREID